MWRLQEFKEGEEEEEEHQSQAEDEEGDTVLDVLDAIEILCDTSNSLHDRLVRPGIPLSLNGAAVRGQDIDEDLNQHMRADEDGMMVLSETGLHISLFHMGREDGKHMNMHVHDGNMIHRLGLLGLLQIYCSLRSPLKVSAFQNVSLHELCT